MYGKMQHVEPKHSPLQLYYVAVGSASAKLVRVDIPLVHDIDLCVFYMYRFVE